MRSYMKWFKTVKDVTNSDIINRSSVMYISIRIIGKFTYGYISLFLIGSSEILEITANHLLSENLASLLIIVVSIFLYNIYKNIRIVYFIILGVSLSFSPYQTNLHVSYYYSPHISIIFAIKQKQKRKIIITGTFIFLILYSLIAGAWCFRNYKQFDDFSITNGGGLVLLTRAYKNSMNSKEYLASFIYWLPGKTVRESLLNRIMDEEDYERFDRTKSISFRRTAQRQNQELIESKIMEGYEEGEAILLADKEHRKEAVDLILKNPLKHIITTVPLAWRGIFIETGYRYEV